MCEQCTVVFTSEIAVAWEEWPVYIPYIVYGPNITLRHRFQVVYASMLHTYIHTYH